MVQKREEKSKILDPSLDDNTVCQLGGLDGLGVVFENAVGEGCGDGVGSSEVLWARSVEFISEMVRSNGRYERVDKISDVADGMCKVHPGHHARVGQSNRSKGWIENIPSAVRKSNLQTRCRQRLIDLKASGDRLSLSSARRRGGRRELSGHCGACGGKGGYWGAKPGPYLMIPILGPTDVRDGIGRIGDGFLNPARWRIH